MKCEADSLAQSSEFFESLLERARRERIPLMGGIELTSRCNLRCVHCYCGDKRDSAAGDGLSTTRTLRLLDELADAGCMFLIFTGGDPLLRDDFRRIYRHARAAGTIVSVYTNGSLVTPEIEQAFRDMPPPASWKCRSTAQPRRPTKGLPAFPVRSSVASRVSGG